LLGSQLIDRTQNRTCGCLKRAVNAAKPTEQLDEVAAFFIAQAREMTDDGVLTIRQAADYCGVTPLTVRHWILQGKIPFYQTVPGAPYYVKVSIFWTRKCKN